MNCSIHSKNREISGPYNFWTPIKNNIPDVWNWNSWTLFPYNFWTPIKNNIPDVWNWNSWTLFGLEIEVGRPWPPLAPPNGYAPAVYCFIWPLSLLTYHLLQWCLVFRKPGSPLPQWIALLCNNLGRVKEIIIRASNTGLKYGKSCENNFTRTLMTPYTYIIWT